MGPIKTIERKRNLFIKFVVKIVCAGWESNPGHNVFAGSKHSKNLGFLLLATSYTNRYTTGAIEY